MKNKKLIIAVISLSLTFLLSLSSLITSLVLFNNIKSNNNSFLIGESFPSNLKGNDNDIYLDSSSLNVYQKINGSWVYLLTLNLKNIEGNKEDESNINQDERTLHKIDVDNVSSINGAIYVHKSSAYYKDTIIFLAKPISEEYSLDKLFFNDKEVNYEVSFIENYSLYSTIMVDEDIKVRGEFIKKTQ